VHVPLRAKSNSWILTHASNQCTQCRIQSSHCVTPRFRPILISWPFSFTDGKCPRPRHGAKTRAEPHCTGCRDTASRPSQATPRKAHQSDSPRMHAMHTAQGSRMRPILRAASHRTSELPSTFPGTSRDFTCHQPCLQCPPCQISQLQTFSCSLPTSCAVGGLKPSPPHLLHAPAAVAPWPSPRPCSNFQPRA
jgi:hypothetical protein